MTRPTLLDRAIAWVAPQTGADRLRARAAFEGLAQRGYDAADPVRTRRPRGNPSADAAIARAGPLVRANMREAARNNPHMASAVSVLVTNIVGSGIMPRANTGDDREDRKVNDLWNRFSDQCDPEGLTDAYGQQSLSVRGMIEGGDGLLRRRPRRPTDRLSVPLQVEFLEAEMLDPTKSGSLDDGGWITQGVEFDAIGRRRGYWLHPAPPGEQTGWLGAGRASSFVSADSVAHLFERQRRQARGMPWLAPVLRSAQDLDDYENAEVTRKKTEACVVGFVIAADEEADEAIAPVVKNADGEIIEKFEPGLIAIVRGSKEVKFHQPSASPDFPAYKRAALHTIAAGARVPYELLTGDMSQVNYSSYRGRMIAYRAFVEAVQWQIVIPGACLPMWRWFCAAAHLAGLIRSPDVPVIWTPPKFEPLDPLKEASADLIALRSGTISLAEVCARSGRTVDEVLAEVARVNGLIDKYKLVLDSDPRQTAKNGAVQDALAAALKD